jgi:hypothetical protein
MTDNDPTDQHDTYEKDVTEKIGPRGSSVYERERRETTLGDDPATQVTRTTGMICTCGAPRDPGQIFRCCSCELTACPLCLIRVRRHHYCPTCARREYVLDKHVFVSLLSLQHDLLNPEDLIQIETVAGAPTDVTIDRAATVLVEHDYLDDSGDLTPAGQEAYFVGKKLYGEDDDIRSMLQQLRIKEVVDHGGT